MAKNGKMNKLKCMIKRWHSSSAITRTPCEDDEAEFELPKYGGACRAAWFDGNKIPEGYYPVYVGKSRRRYLVSSDLFNHPLFQNLVECSGGDGDGSGDERGTIVECEVVLFDHLLWMLMNAEPRKESLDDIIHFYER